MTDVPPHQPAAAAPAVIARLERTPPQLTNSDTVVFHHTKLPSSRQSSVVAGMGSPTSTSFQNSGQPQKKKLCVENVPGQRRHRLTIRVTKHGDTLGFGVRHDRFKRLRVSTLQGTTSDLRVGDALLSVNGVDLTGLEFLAVIGQLKATRPGELVFEVEREEKLQGDGTQQSAKPMETESIGVTRSLAAASVATTSIGVSPQRAVTMLDSNGQPVNVTALMADLKKERAEKTSLEEKNTGLRKRLQRMLIENDEVRVRAGNEVATAQEKAKREVTEAQNQLAAARAQLRLQDRGPDVARTDSVVNELIVCKAQIERLKNSEAERNSLLTARYRGECRIAAADAQRVLDTLAGMFCTKLRHVGRANRDGASNTEVEVACDGVRRLAFMKLFRLAHDFTFYSSAAFHSQEVMHHTIEQEQFTELFGNTLFHEERAGLFYVATVPMHVAYDAKSESVTLKCQWAEQNALRELARNFRF
ncbi:hypothetical protein BBJ29_001105 [Phytophthora kernoviae]|uniref:PDZ domain-containing protein n=1 Tax=Phytophthora kernoviae TaxID=325452 RepID=A0A3F2RX71_9STRA|nr:hypothetical protein BBJ29_001105 [Phytophthora kernoviae]RLN65055.1 hypothetical protein BBP00_00003074 [Phytophthora kernoviae]